MSGFFVADRILGRKGKVMRKEGQLSWPSVSAPGSEYSLRVYATCPWYRYRRVEVTDISIGGEKLMSPPEAVFGQLVPLLMLLGCSLRSSNPRRS